MSRKRRTSVFWFAVALLVATNVARGFLGLGADAADGAFGSLYTIALELLAAGICVHGAVTGGRSGRLPRILLAIGIAVFAAGDASFFLLLDRNYSGFPAVSDYLWAVFYAAALGSLAIQTRRAMRPVRLVVWLDAAIVGVTFAAVMAQVFYDHGFHDAVLDKHVVAGELSYALFDLIWLAGFAALWVAVGWRRLGGFRIAGVGFAAVLVADSLSVLQVAGNSYQGGTLINSLWPAGFLLIAAAPTLPAALVPGRRGAAASAIVPVAGLLACVAMLGIETQEQEGVWVVAAIAAVLAISLSLVRVLVTLVDNESLLAERHAALERVRQSEERYRRILETTGEGVWIVDAENFTTFVNARMAEMLGTTQDALLGTTILDFAAGADAADVRAEIALDQHYGGEQRDVPLKRVDGSLVWALTSTTPINGADGTFEGAVSMVNDVTARRHAEQELRFQAGLLDQVDASLVAIDTDGKIVYWSRGAEKLHGWTSQEATGRRARELIAPDTSESAGSSRRVIDADSSELEMELARKDGGRVAVYSRNSSIRDQDGTVLGSVAVSMDVSERKRAEAESRLLAAMVESSNVAMVSCDLDGLVTSWNAGAEALYGWPAEVAVGGHLDLIFDGDGATEERELWRLALEPGASVGATEARRRTRDGDLLDISLNVSAIRDRDGAVVGVSSMAYDISERRRAELAAAVQHAGDTVLAGSHTIEEALPRLLEALGSVLGFDAGRAHLFEGMAVQKFEWTRPGAHDTTGPLLPAATVPVASGDAPIGELDFFTHAEQSPEPGLVETLRTVGSQIGQFVRRRQAEEDLRSTSERLQAILDNTPALVFVKDRSFRYVVGNRAFETLHDLEPGASAGMRDEDILPPDVVEHIRSGDRDVLDHGEIVQQETVVPRDEPRTFVAVKFPLRDAYGGVYAVGTVATDITESRRAIEDRELSEERLAEAQQIAQVGSFVHDVAAGTMVWSDELYRIYGLPTDSPAPLPAKVIDLVHPDDRRDFEAALVALRQGGTHALDMRIVRPGGESRFVSSRCQAQLGADGMVTKVAGVMQDTTGSRAAERNLRESEERYRRIVETANEGVWMVDADGRTTFANAHMAQMLGCTQDEMPGRSLFEFATQASVERAVRRLAARRDWVGDVLDVKLLRSDGSEFWVMMSASAMTAEDGTYLGALAMVTDITDRVAAQGENERLQGELHQSQKLESVGQLAGGIAHDFNNLLSVILNYAEFATEDTANPEQLGEDISSIREAAERATELTRQLLVFSRREPIAATVVDLNAVVARTRRLLGRTLGEHIELVTDLADAGPSVFADSGLFEQVLMNLAVNARDAIGDAGTITITTGEERREGVPGAEPGLYARITVSDDGCGMSQEVVARALEPFYTTKARGSGTGLGLSTVYGIVKQAGGTIELRSEENVGTSVDVYLPCVSEPPPTSEPQPDHDEPIWGSSQLVLVVEDEADVRRVTCRTLARYGYDVLEASGPEAAKAIWEEHDGQIDLVLTDVVMPGGSGKTLVDELQRTRADVRCVYMSGYTDDILVRHGTGNDQVPLLVKPFSRNALLHSVHEAITE